jgi:hypothetical protein
MSRNGLPNGGRIFKKIPPLTGDDYPDRRSSPELHAHEMRPVALHNSQGQLLCAVCERAVATHDDHEARRVCAGCVRRRR